MSPALAEHLSAASVALAKALASIGKAPPSNKPHLRRIFALAADDAITTQSPIPGTTPERFAKAGDVVVKRILRDLRVGQAASADLAVAYCVGSTLRQDIEIAIPCPSTPAQIVALWNAALIERAQTLATAHNAAISTLATLTLPDAR
jgi:hypothetical protein